MKATKCYTLDLDVIAAVDALKGEKNASEYVNELLKTMFVMLGILDEEEEEAEENDKKDL